MASTVGQPAGFHEDDDLTLLFTPSAASEAPLILDGGALGMPVAAIGPGVIAPALVEISSDDDPALGTASMSDTEDDASCASTVPGILPIPDTWVDTPEVPSPDPPLCLPTQVLPPHVSVRDPGDHDELFDAWFAPLGSVPPSSPTDSQLTADEGGMPVAAPMAYTTMEPESHDDTLDDIYEDRKLDPQFIASWKEILEPLQGEEWLPC